MIKAALSPIFVNTNDLLRTRTLLNWLTIKLVNYQDFCVIFNLYKLDLYK